MRRKLKLPALVLIVVVGFFACGNPRGDRPRGMIADPSVTSPIAISADKMPSYGELKSILKAEPITGGLTGQFGAPIQNGSVATWFVDNRTVLAAYFASVPISESDIPFRVVAKAPFQGEIASCHIGDSPATVDRWARSANKCGYLRALGASSQRRDGDLVYTLKPICQPIPHMPSSMRWWATYQVGVAFDSHINAILLENFHVREIKRDGKFYYDRGHPADIAPDLLSVMWNDIAPDRSVKTSVDFFSDPNNDYGNMYPQAPSGYNALCTSLTDKDAIATMELFREFPAAI